MILIPTIYRTNFKHLFYEKPSIIGFKVLIDTETLMEKSKAQLPTYLLPCINFMAGIPTVCIYSTSNSGHQGEMLMHGEV